MARTKGKGVHENKQPDTSAIKSCGQCARWKEVKQKMRIAAVLERAADQFEHKLNESEFKPSVAEYLKLVQMEQEFEKELDGPKEITVRWVEQQPTSKD